MGYLDGLGAPVVPPSLEVDPGPHRWAGHDISFWTYAENDPAASVSTKPTVHDLPGCLAELDRGAGLLPPAQLAGVRGGRSPGPFVADPGVVGATVQQVLGDVHPGHPQRAAMDRRGGPVPGPAGVGPGAAVVDGTGRGAGSPRPRSAGAGDLLRPPSAAHPGVDDPLPR